MNAFKQQNNLVAWESAKNEVENIVIAYKKSNSDLKHLIFIAELCEEYDLKNLAKICYYSVLTSKNAEINTVKEVANKCVRQYSSEALLINLKVAYENSKGDNEIRFCGILCALNIKGIDAVKYFEIKNRVRDLIEKNVIEESLSFLEDLSLMFNDDPEIHYYLAEIYSRKNLVDKAHSHFQTMFTLDKYNLEAMVKYVYFLLKNKLYADAIKISKHTIDFQTLLGRKSSEIHWALAAAYFSQEKYELCNEEILKSDSHDPWNISYISLKLRCSLHLLENSALPDAFSFITKIEEYSMQHEKIEEEKKEILIQSLSDYSLFCIRKGFYEIGWSFAKCTLLINKKFDEKIGETLSRAAGAYLPKITIPQLLILLKEQSDVQMSFYEITACIAKTYGLTGQWELVDEWISMAQNYLNSDKTSQSKLFELEALSMTMQGNDMKKAQNLLEAAIDCYENHEDVPFETKILHGYILVTQGNISQGLEKIQSNINENASIQSLYFFVKGLERAGILSSISKESIEQMSHTYPSNSLEQKMVEEIFYTVSSKINCIPLGLAC